MFPDLAAHRGEIHRNGLFAVQVMGTFGETVARHIEARLHDGFHLEPGTRGPHGELVIHRVAPVGVLLAPDGQFEAGQQTNTVTGGIEVDMRSQAAGSAPG
jgi:hypothetical protein